MTPPLRQRWRWCLGCYRLFKDYPTKFCPFDDWYLMDSRPGHVPTRLRNIETGAYIKETLHDTPRDPRPAA